MEARNITTGGIFLASDFPAELQSEVELTLTTVDGSSVDVRARVVRHSTPPGVRSPGVERGLGLRFETLDEAQREAIGSIVDHARAHDSRRRIPRLMSEALGARPLSDPLLAYLCQHVDGRRTPEELANRVGLDLDAVVELIHELCELDVIELCPPPDAALSSNAAVALDRLSARGSAPGVPAVESESDAALRSELEARSACRDHYALLRVEQDAGRDSLRAAFLELTARFGPDAVAPGDAVYASKAERFILRVASAYATLASPEARDEYDAYRARAQLIRAVENPETNHPATSDELTQLHELQGRYEERHQDWDRAAASWTRVYEGRPDDAQCAHRAARALLESKLELRRAQCFAERAIALAPNEPVNHRLLARIFLETGLRLRAKKELQLAAALARKQRRDSKRLASNV